MLLTVFGATGSIGRHVVEQALAEGHAVRAFARHPEALPFDHADLTRMSGDVHDGLAVERAVAGADAVVVTLGSKGITGRVRSEGTRRIIEAMRRTGVRRLICQSTLGVGESRSNLDFFWKYVMFGFLLRAVFRDHVRQEAIVRNSGLDWTIVRPSAFVDEPQPGAIRHGFAPTDRKLTLKIARPEVARFLLRQISDDSYLHLSPGLSC